MASKNYMEAREREEITKEEFETYEKVRISGETNMWDIKAVVRFSNFILDEKKCLTIMGNYGKLMEKFPGVRKS